MANNREISQFAGLVTVDDTTNAVTIGSTLNLSSGSDLGISSTGRVDILDGGDLIVRNSGGYLAAPIAIGGTDYTLAVAKSGQGFQAGFRGDGELRIGAAPSNSIETSPNIQLRYDGSAKFGSSVDIDSDGVKFNGDTAAANALDDYEEGTFTPVSTNFTSPRSLSGKYIKIGRVMHVFITETGSGSVSVPSNVTFSTYAPTSVPIDAVIGGTWYRSNYSYETTATEKGTLMVARDSNRIYLQNAGFTMTNFQALRVNFSYYA